jgi:hypothetical protein
MPLSIRIPLRTFFPALLLVVSASAARAQDPAADAAQQATQQTMQANQQAMEASQQAIQQAQQASAQAMQQAQQDAQNAAQNTASNASIPYAALKPKFSVKAGTYSQTVAVKMTDSTRGAIIYYTTDGWTPTVNSNRYLGPVAINSTTTLQAIAIVPYGGRSLVNSAQYVINSPSNSSPSNSATSNSAMAPNAPLAANQGANDNAPAAGAPNELYEGTPVEFAFAGEVSSKTASVGDKIPVTLASDLMAGPTVVAKTGTPATVTIIQVDNTGAGGAPGDLVFQADALNVNGKIIGLRGSEEREGEAKPPNAAALIPVVGPFTVFKHGKDAEITKGTAFTAYVDKDIPLASLQ